MNSPAGTARGGMNLGPSKPSERWNQKTLGNINLASADVPISTMLSSTTITTASTSNMTIGNSINAQPSHTSTSNGWMAGTAPPGHLMHGPAHGPKGLLRQSWSPHSSNHASGTSSRSNSGSSPSSSSAIAGQSEAALRGTLIMISTLFGIFIPYDPLPS